METVMDQMEAILTKIDKLDDRVRSLERYVWAAVAVIGFLQFAAPYISRFLGATS
jgi:hypothetical protein